MGQEETEEVMAEPEPESPVAVAPLPRLRPAARGIGVPLGIGGGVLLVLFVGGLLLHRAGAGRNHVALAATPKGVTTVTATAGVFRREHRYVGTIEPWVEARIGPQYTSAYVQSVLVRPGQAVKRGAVVATLDCRNASAQTRAIAMQARALQATQEALAHEATRVSGLLKGGYVSPNEAEVKTAASQAKQAELLATQARLLRASLEVNDCVLRAPFDGEIADRFVDPGAFVRPGSAVLRLVDRGTVRVTAAVPENDFEAVAPGRPVALHLLATGQQVSAKITRRSPAADLSTRTVHVEVDVADPGRLMPVGSTATLTVSVGDPVPASVIPLAAARVRGRRATLFLVGGDVVRRVTVPVVGERAGSLYLGAGIQPGACVVTEGRTALADGDHVSARCGR